MNRDIPFSFVRSGIEFVNLPWEKRYFNPGKTPLPQGLGRYDDEGIAGSARENRLMDGPVVNAGILLTRLDAYVVSGEQVYLDLAIRHAERMVQVAYEVEDALYFPYMYQWNLHAFEDYSMDPPWFSGMAQGYLLSSFSRLYEVTGDDRYLDFATKTFNSFLQPRGDNPVWTTDLEAGEYLWFEEYARNTGPSDRAFNGHIYAIWGLHDYWMATSDSRAEALADGGLTALMHFLDKWRFPGGQSFYCLNHRERSASYHAVHTEQLVYLFSITADPLFLKLADLFIDDYPYLIYQTALHPAIHVEAGTYSLHRSGGLDSEEVVEVTFDEPVELAWDVRGVIRGERLASARCIDGPHRLVWFPEQPLKIWTAGKVDSLVWHQPLTLTINIDWGGRLWDYDAETDQLNEAEPDTSIGAHVVSDQRAKLNGQHCYRIAGGPGDGLWIARDDVEIVLS